MPKPQLQTLFFFVGIILILPCYCQVSSKSQSFNLEKSIEKLGLSDDPSALFKGDSICSQQIRYIGSIQQSQETERHFVTSSTDYGPSCKANTKILVFAQDELLGMYQTPSILPDTVVKDHFEGSYESGEVFSVRITDTLIIAEQSIIFKRLN